MREPLTPVEARKQLTRILAGGKTVGFSKHALARLREHGLTTVDATNVLRGGTVDPAENENGSWRYRVRTPRMCVVVVFVSETEIKVVTAIRFGR